MKSALNYCAKALRQKKVAKFQCSLKNVKQQEMNLEGTDFSLIRTTTDNTLQITVIEDNRKGTISLNRIDEKSIDEAVTGVLELAHTSKQDADYDIAPAQAPQEFAAGPQEPDIERMYGLLKEYSGQVPSFYPAIRLMESALLHKQTRKYLINSNGVDFLADQGVYNLSTVFSSKDGQKTTSFNYTGFAMQDLETPLLERASLRDLLQQSVEHLEARPFSGKLTGDIILTPDCLQSILYFYTTTFLGDAALIAGTSPFKGKLGQQVASERLTLAAQPLSPQMAEGYFLTDDGFAAENTTLIENGVLRSYLLSQYAAKKTGLERAKNQGGNWILAPGDKKLAELISEVERGLLVARYSGGYPSPNGDFSGVAKNSYYIENGEILYPVAETMIAGNLGELFLNVKGVTQQAVDFGDSLLPHILTTGVTISGS